MNKLQVIGIATILIGCLAFWYYEDVYHIRKLRKEVKATVRPYHIKGVLEPCVCVLVEFNGNTHTRIFTGQQFRYLSKQQLDYLKDVAREDFIETKIYKLEN